MPKKAPITVALLLALASGAKLGAQPSVLTWHNDNARTGQNLQETILSPANVNAATFGRLFGISVDGKVDAQPLYVPSLTIPATGQHNVLYVATEHDSAYAYDADNGTQLWHVSLLGANETPSDNRGCGQVTPEIGITATPVIDPQSGPHGTMYAVAMSKDATGNYHQRLHALDLTTGVEQFGGPVEIQATYAGSGDESAGGVVTFDPKQHKDRAALLLVNGVVYTSWGSHCDIFPYTGWVIGYDERTLSGVSVLNLTPNGSDGGIWAAGSGPAADASGNLYLLMGNGTFDTLLNANGFPSKGDFGNTFIKMSAGGGTLAVADYFTMFNTVSESNGDVDLGSGGAMLLPAVNNPHGQPVSLAVGAGKDLNVYVVNTNNMGRFNTNTNNIFQTLTLNGGVFSSPAWFNGNLYYGAVGDALKAFSFVNGAFGTNPISQSAQPFPYPGTTPSISASGVSNAIVWAAEGNSSPAVLHAYDAANLSRELYNSNQAPNGRDLFGTGNKFIVPTIVNGKVYVGTTDGVGVFGLISVPLATSVTPSSGSGASQTFQFAFSDANGAADLSFVQLIVNATLSGLNGCEMQYTPASNSLLLLNDAANGWIGPATLGIAAVLQNSQCSVNVGSSSAVSSGNSLTVTVGLSFPSSFAGNKGTYMYAQGSGGLNSGWQQRGTWTAPGAASSPPQVVSVTPSSGSGASQTFQFAFSDANGAADLFFVQLIVNATLSGLNGCEMQYTPASNSLLLLNDAANGWIGPATLGAAVTLQNSQCSVNVGSSSAASSGNSLTVTLGLSFPSSFAGNKGTYMYAQGSGGLNSGWQQRGTWTAPGAASSPPQAVSVTPSSGSGASQTFQFAFSDANGAADLSFVQLIVNATLSGLNGCEMQYTPASNSLLLLNDAANGWIGPATLGTAAVLQNSQCSVNVGSSSAVSSGNSLTVTLGLSFPSSFAGNKGTYMYAQGSGGLNSGWQQRGTWTAPGAASSPPQAVSVTPSSGSGASQTFQFAFSDANGAADLFFVQLIVNATLSGLNGCEMQYTPASNSLLLLNDAANGWIGPATLGTAAVLQNSQCSVNVGSSSAASSGNSLTVTLGLSFPSSFAGNKGTYMYAQGSGGLNSGWQQRGTWTAPGAAGSPPQAAAN